MRITVLILSLIFLWAGPLLAREKVAGIHSVSGQVDLLRHEEIVPAVPGQDLFENDILTTGPGSTIGFTFLDGTRVSLGPSSEIQINEYLFKPSQKIFSFDMYMKKGTAVYSSGIMEKMAPEKIFFKTPTTTVGVRGTRFLVRVN